MPIKSVKMKISKNKKMLLFLMSQGSLNPKIRFLGQKVCPVARGRTDGQTHRPTDQTHTKVTTEGTLSWFQEFSFNLSPSIGPIYTYIKVKVGDPFHNFQ